MASSMARGARRRRVLNEEVRSASGLTLHASSDGAGQDPDAPRYGEQAGVEHHPQVTDFVPRRKRAVLVTLFAGLLAATIAQTAAHYAEAVSTAIPGVTAAAVRDQFAAGVADWTAAIQLLAVAGLARLIFSLRRHRVDDYRGRYRVWRWVAWGAILASVNAVVHMHELTARMAVAATGWSLTSGGAEWWLAPVALVGAWMFVRLLWEVSESRSALLATLLAATCYGTAAASALGWSPAGLGAWSDALIGAVPLIGHTLALVSAILLARYVILDVQGLIEHAPRAAKPKKLEKKPAEATAEAPPKPVTTPATPVAAAPPATMRAALDLRAARVAEKPTPPADKWVDGSEPDEDEEEDGPATRKLSKLERKRLRKQQRAA